jgi:hypothetical protein
MNLDIKIEYSQPVELADLTLSLQGLARSYRRYATQHDVDVGDAVKLYVREIKSGSIVVDLVNEAVNYAATSVPILAGATLPDLTSKAKMLLDFTKFVKGTYDFFKGASPKPADLTAPHIKDLANVLEPVAKDSNGTVSINARDSAQVYVQVTINQTEANAIQNKAEREIEALKVPDQKTFKKVLLYWHKATADSSSHPSDRAIIDSITDKPLRVFFPDDDVATKAAMIAGKDNPFTAGFLVDVELQTIKGEPYAYKVTHLYETLNDGAPSAEQPS